jgi:hypothetical protein
MAQSLGTSENGFHSDSGRVVDFSDAAVVRKTDYWSPAVHELLHYLQRVGFAEAPRLLSVTSDDQEKLTYIEGGSGSMAWAKIVPDEGLRAFAGLLRKYHDAVHDFQPTHTRWAMDERKLSAGEIVTHGDYGPWNIVWHGNKTVGLIDWDLAGPGKPLDDIAYALEYSVPFRSDEECVRWLKYPEPPNRAKRMTVFAEAYGLPGIDGFYEAVIERQERTVANVHLLAERGLEPQATWICSGFLDELQARIEWTKANQELFL